MNGVITPNEVQQAEEREKEVSEKYFGGIVDFLKWTSSFTAAALIWTGTSIGAKTGLSYGFAIMCMVFLVFSLAVAVWTVRVVLIAWGAKWAAASALNSFYSMKNLKHVEPKNLAAEKERDTINRLLTAVDAVRPFDTPQRFSRWVTVHTGFLLAGLLCYIASQLWG